MEETNRLKAIAKVRERNAAANTAQAIVNKATIGGPRK